jgi:hypothetical protein
MVVYIGGEGWLAHLSCADVGVIWMVRSTLSNRHRSRIAKSRRSPIANSRVTGELPIVERESRCFQIGEWSLGHGAGRFSVRPGSSAPRGEAWVATRRTGAPSENMVVGLGAHEFLVLAGGSTLGQEK